MPHRILAAIRSQPWAILPEIDYLVASELGPRAQEGFLADLADGSFAVEHGRHEDLVRAQAIGRKYRSLRLGLVDAVVIAVAERTGADASAAGRLAQQARSGSFRLGREDPQVL